MWSPRRRSRGGARRAIADANAEGRPRERRARRAWRSRRVTETVRRTQCGIRARRARAPRLFACSRVRFLSSARAPRAPNRASSPRWNLDPRRRRGGVQNAERARRRGAVAPRPRARRARRHRPPRQTERRVEVVGLEATPASVCVDPQADVVDGIDDIGIVFLLFRVSVRHRQARNAFDRRATSALTRALASLVAARSSRAPRVAASPRTLVKSRASPLRHATSRSGRPWRRPSSPPPALDLGDRRRPRRVVGRDVFGGVAGAARPRPSRASRLGTSPLRAPRSSPAP